MSVYEGLKRPFKPDWQALIDNIHRKGTPRRVHFMELFHDVEIRDALVERFDLMKGVSPDDPAFGFKRRVAVNRFCGWDYVCVQPMDIAHTFANIKTDDTAALKRNSGRTYRDEHVGPITTWEQFEKYPWPDPAKPSMTRDFEWFQKNLPDDMCIAAFTGHVAEELSWLFGYETFCYALYEQRDLVEAVAKKIEDYYRTVISRVLQFDRVKIVWATDDMGFKTSLMVSPADMRQYVLPTHKMMAKMSHDAGRAYLLHACGKLDEIIDDLIDDVGIDGKHSFEDTIEDVCQAKQTYGRRTALIGGIDVDFLCRSTPADIRKRVRRTLDACLPGGGYCLGSGNSVTNYMPLDNYLTMIDEGRLYGKA